MLSDPDMKLDFEYKENDFDFKYESIINKCYLVDRNEIPAKYKLQNIDQIFNDFFLNVRSF
jgi:hypothetical protein